ATRGPTRRRARILRALRPPPRARVAADGDSAPGLRLPRRMARLDILGIPDITADRRAAPAAGRFGNAPRSEAEAPRLAHARHIRRDIHAEPVSHPGCDNSRGASTATGRPGRIAANQAKRGPR